MIKREVVRLEAKGDDGWGGDFYRTHTLAKARFRDADLESETWYGMVRTSRAVLNVDLR